jgi:hypothetical protein
VGIELLYFGRNHSNRREKDELRMLSILVSSTGVSTGRARSA